MNKYVSVLAVGVKETLQFRGEIFGELFAQALTLLLLVSIWNSLTGENLTGYYIVAVFLLVAPFRLVPELFRSEVSHGWSVSFAKPLAWFPYLALRSAGIESAALLSFLALGAGMLLVLGIPFSPGVAAACWLFLAFFELSRAYFISSFSHFVYSTWGIAMMFDILDVMLGGYLIPFTLLPPEYLGYLSVLPFAHKTYYFASGILDGALPVASFAVLLAWSAAFFIAGRALHAAGRRRFEAQGG